MKRIILSIFVFNIFICVSAQAKIPFMPGEFDVDKFQYPHMVLIDNPESAQIDTKYTFTDREKSYQLRYSFFKQTERDFTDIRNAFTVYSIMLIYNIAGYEVDLSQFRFFNDNDVKNEFNGDFGISGIVLDSTSDYGREYKYILLNIYYKNNQGIVVSAIMSNEMNFFLDIESTKYDQIFHSFKFKNVN